MRFSKWGESGKNARNERTASNPARHHRHRLHIVITDPDLTTSSVVRRRPLQSPREVLTGDESCDGREGGDGGV